MQEGKEGVGSPWGTGQGQLQDPFAGGGSWWRRSGAARRRSRLDVGRLPPEGGEGKEEADVAKTWGSWLTRRSRSREASGPASSQASVAVQGQKADAERWQQQDVQVDTFQCTLR